MNDQTPCFELQKFLSGTIDGHALQRSDVVIVQSKKSFFAKLIRWATESTFSHAALVFAIPHSNQGFDRGFLIESSVGGVDLTALDKHTNLPAHKNVLVIMRLEQPWFDEHMQRRVRGELLNTIKANYDYRAIVDITLAVITSMLFGKRSDALVKIKNLIRERFKIKGLVPVQFICSGFVQFGYWHTVKNLLPHVNLQEVYFGEETDGDPPTDADLLTMTPIDIFRAKTLAVKYVITGGCVYPVTDKEACLHLLQQAEAGLL